MTLVEAFNVPPAADTAGRRPLLPELHGAGVIVCSGARIVENTVVGAGSVVLAYLPAYALVAETAARLLRRLAAEG